MKGASSMPSFSCLRPPTSLAHWNSFPSLLLLLTNGIVLGAGLRYAIIRLFIHNTRQIEVEQHDVDNDAGTILKIVEEDYHDDAPPKQFIVSIRGLKNRGQTCYANSVLQALASLKPFYDHLKVTGGGSCSSNSTVLVDALLSTIQYVNGHEVSKEKNTRQSSKNIFSSFIPFISGPSPGDPKIVMDLVAKHHSQFRSRNSLSIAGTSEQQDSHEFLSALMDVLSMEERSAVQHETRIPVIEGHPMHSQAIETADNADEQIISMHRAENGSTDKENQHNEPKEEEKKLDDKIPMHYQNSNTEEEQPTTAANIEDTTSSRHQQRNPFNGWLGSTIKCAKCYHIRPIRSNPFICLSLPIASVRSEYLEDFLASEYGGFSTEQVSDVQCVSCDIKEKVTELEEEVLLLSGAIDSMKRRKKDQAAGLQSELLSKKRQITILKGIDADNDEEIEHHNEEDISFSIAGLSKIIPMRGNAHKATLIIRSPTVLGIHVQRRHFDMSSQQMMKMSRRVHFPEVLDISQYCSFERLYTKNKANGEKLPYRLMSVVEHKGNAFGGHYQTYRRAGSKDWVLVSDESVLPVSWNDVQRCEAYMLLYEKIS